MREGGDGRRRGVEGYGDGDGDGGGGCGGGGNLRLTSKDGTALYKMMRGNGTKSRSSRNTPSTFLRTQHSFSGFN